MRSLRLAILAGLCWCWVNSPVAQAQSTSNPSVTDTHSGVSLQGTLDGFWNIPWKSSAETVKKQMKAKSGFAETVSDEVNCVTYKGGTFANLEVRQLKFRFFHDQLFGVLVIFESTADQKSTADNLLFALKAKYGEPTDEAAEHNLPDPDWSWTFQDENALNLSIPSPSALVTNSGLIWLYYKNLPLFNAWSIEASGINPSNL
jgi:hypothetical protein